VAQHVHFSLGSNPQNAVIVTMQPVCYSKFSVVCSFIDVVHCGAYNDTVAWRLMRHKARRYQAIATVLLQTLSDSQSNAAKLSTQQLYHAGSALFGTPE